MITATHRHAQLIIDRQAIYDNVQNEIKRLKKGTDLFAVIKADAYGHGLLEVAKITKQAGAKGFCVALLDEALALRQAGFEEPILVLGVTDPDQTPIAANHHISVAAPSLAWLQQATPFLNKDAQTPLRIHYAIDSGMGRIGMRDISELQAAVKLVREQRDAFEVEGIFTHFATADDPNPSYFNKQVAKWQELLASLDERPHYVHVSNSATSLWHAKCNGNMIRFGLAIYGLNPSGRAISSLPYPLKPAMALTSELTFCKQIHAGDSVGYGATYTAKGDEWIGTVPIGYADGWRRDLQGFKVLVDGQYCEIVGRICMDQLMIKLPHEYPTGTTVVFIGRSGMHEITAQDVAEYEHTINYEVVSDFMPRLPRVYVGLENQQ